METFLIYEGLIRKNTAYSSEKNMSTNVTFATAPASSYFTGIPNTSARRRCMVTKTIKSTMRIIFRAGGKIQLCFTSPASILFLQ